MTKFTPGPWWTPTHEHAISSVGDSRASCPVYVDGPDGNIAACIADVYAEKADCERDPDVDLPAVANARLIAAAPDLLAALIRLHLAFESDENSHWSCWDEARAAIVKAVGDREGVPAGNESA